MDTIYEIDMGLAGILVRLEDAQAGRIIKIILCQLLNRDVDDKTLEMSAVDAIADTYRAII